MRNVVALVLLLTACTAEKPDYQAEGNTLEVGFGEAPEEIRTAVAEALDTCDVPLSSVKLLPPHGPWAKGWRIELPPSLVKPTIIGCIDRDISRLKLASEIAWSEEPPPPPPGFVAREEFLLIAAERRVDEPANVPPIPDARKLLPKALQRCGIDSFHEEEITDGIFALKFMALPKDRSDRLSCIQREQPRGAWVEQVL